MARAAERGGRRGSGPPLSYAGLMQRVLGVWFGLTALLVALSLLDLLILHRSPAIAVLYFVQQDVELLLGAGVLLALLSRSSPPHLNLVFRAPGAWPLIAAVAAGLAALAGGHLVFLGYDLSGDESMANFDAKIFATGHAVAQIPEAWRRYAGALQPVFLLQTADHAHWASSYLPINAAIRALAGTLHMAALVNPLWTGIAVVAVVGVARRIWPDRPLIAVVAAILLGTSAQVLVAGMTSYAMPAHLALNLVWLWCFVRGDRKGHAGALACGFLATGLHQLVFHPLFAAPFVLQLWVDRRWSAAALYTAAYAAICGFWLLYWPIALHLSGLSADVGGAGGPVWFVQKVAWLFGRFDPANIGALALDLTRFLAWQNPLTIPLAGIACVGAVRAKGLLRSLVLGVAATLLTVFVLLPYQDHGWGYRYFHGVLGSFCLLAAWGWAELTKGLTAAEGRKALSGFVCAALFSGLVLAPFCLWQAAGYVRPYALAHAAITRTDADVVIVDDSKTWYAETLVRNDPGLTDRPLVMKLDQLDATGLRILCAGHSVVVFDRSDAARLGIRASGEPIAEPAPGSRRRLLADLKCDARGDFSQ